MLYFYLIIKDFVNICNKFVLFQERGILREAILEKKLHITASEKEIAKDSSVIKRTFRVAVSLYPYYTDYIPKLIHIFVCMFILFVARKMKSFLLVISVEKNRARGNPNQPSILQENALNQDSKDSSLVQGQDLKGKQLLMNGLSTVS